MAPGGLEVDDGLNDLGATQHEDVVFRLPEAPLRKQGAKLAHLVPELGHEPVLDVEVVVLDVGEHRARQAQSAVELGKYIALEKVTVDVRDLVTLCLALVELALE